MDPRGNYVGEIGSATDEEIVIRDLDLSLVRQVRDDWQFYRDRRPDTYGPIIAP
ncbi:beta-alanine synthase domain protein [Mycobacteroides abscessus MAB_030201_1075]|uniref:Beta-alanine synthase domain protein n=1 Tax=Mycobacteroides abscessus MAB_030201_1075 TaxID=1335410 RepID=A0A829PRI8_9MYCO|nr:beta-alanine synthase domain protein [Mycobacteroides abscessus MAB_030201_1075]